MAFRNETDRPPLVTIAESPVGDAIGLGQNPALNDVLRTFGVDMRAVDQAEIFHRSNPDTGGQILLIETPTLIVCIRFQISENLRGLKFEKVPKTADLPRFQDAHEDRSLDCKNRLSIAGIADSTEIQAMKYMTGSHLKAALLPQQTDSDPEFYSAPALHDSANRIILSPAVKGLKNRPKKVDIVSRGPFLTVTEPGMGNTFDQVDLILLKMGLQRAYNAKLAERHTH